MPGTDAPERPLRADAVRNRARILAAAAEVFAERGLDVTLDDIAHHAGLGVGTVYRRFADRESLIEALFEERMQEAAERMRIAAHAPDAWLALIGEIRATCEVFAADRGLRQVMLSSVHGLELVARGRDRVRLAVEELVERAKETGRLRSDFEATDIPILFLMVSSVIDFAGAIQPELWRRYLNMLIEGMQAPTVTLPRDGADGLTVNVTTAALSDEELVASMQVWRPMTLR
jgi:AcrR family transcriptional regulator